MSTRILSDADVRSLLTMRDAIAWMRGAFADLHHGVMRVPVRTGFEMPEMGAGLLTMPVLRTTDGLLGIKLITLHDRNPAAGQPRSRATILVVEAENGRVRGIMDGEYVTAVRTGAGSGLATDLMAARDAHTLAVFGAGPIAEHQVEAVCEVRPIERVHVFARSGESARRFVDRMEGRVQARLVAQPPRSAIREADVICTATNSLSPVFSDDELAPAVHINGVGSYRPGMAEVPAETVGRAAVVVDQREASLVEAGDLLQAMASGAFAADRIYADLGELAAGAVGPPAVGGCTFFKSVGNAVQDLAVAAPLLALAAERGVGVEVELAG